jgi:hypothetical protein
MSVVIGVALGGLFGVLSRYGLDRFIEQRGDSAFPLSPATSCSGSSQFWRERASGGSRNRPRGS